MTDQPPTGDRPAPEAQQPEAPVSSTEPEMPAAAPPSPGVSVPQWTSAEAAPAVPASAPVAPEAAPATEPPPAAAAAPPAAAAIVAAAPVVEAAVTPPPPVAPPPMAAPPPAQPAWQAPPAAPPKTPEVPGAPGRYFAATVTRVAALLIDSIIIGIVAAFVGGLVGSIVGGASPTSFFSDFDGVRSAAASAVTVTAGLGAALVSYLYFVLLWRSGGKATVGQRVFRMQVGHAFDGATLTWQQASIRWLALYGLTILTAIPVLAALGGLAAFIWSLVLLISTATSATKQGVHDRWANSAVVATGSQNTTLAWGCLIAYVVGIFLFIVVALAALIAIVAAVYNLN